MFGEIGNGNANCSNQVQHSCIRFIHLQPSQLHLMAILLRLVCPLTKKAQHISKGLRFTDARASV